MENNFLKYLTGFQKSHNTQLSLLRMTESRKAQLNNSAKVGTIIMDLAKAFNSLNNNLPTKLKAYGDFTTIQLIFYVTIFLTDANVVK